MLIYFIVFFFFFFSSLVLHNGICFNYFSSEKNIDRYWLNRKKIILATVTKLSFDKKCQYFGGSFDVTVSCNSFSNQLVEFASVSDATKIL